jgi:Flp pilus assembly pilin Flp
MLKLFALTQSWAMDAADAWESLKKREEGQTMAEYGVVLAVITLVVILALGLLSTNIKNAISKVAGILPQ